MAALLAAKHELLSSLYQSKQMIISRHLEFNLKVIIIQISAKLQWELIHRGLVSVRRLDCHVVSTQW